ncbi:hypothetical protein [Caloranaerobacter sp. DY30410]|uniref:hypothetical protein n=1 Tax=Caloranaerobacter sp. DY30410 TaxID=3238305 RepID=UPI003D090AFF
MKNIKKMFRLNDDGVAEFIVAKSKLEALNYAANIWGIDTVLAIYDDYKKYNPDMTPEKFIETFVIDGVFTHYEYGEHGKTVTKTIKEFLDDIEEVPSYFAYEDC